MNGLTPEKPVVWEASDAHVHITANGETIVDTRKAMLVRELGHTPVWYVPREDIVAERFSETDHSTHCPRKGDATYWTISAGGEELANAAWSYEDPISKFAPLKGYLAFYPEHVEVRVDALEHAG